jgi:hypothetical protein
MLSKKVAAVVVSVMWVIWSSRNKFTHGELQYQPQKSLEIVGELIRALKIPIEEKLRIRIAEVGKPTRMRDG